MQTVSDEELKRRIAQAKQNGWSDQQINRFVSIDRALRSQGAAADAQQQQATAVQPATPQAPGWKKFLVNAGALAGQTVAGIGGAILAPETGGASLLAAGAAGSGIDALKRKLLGEKQSIAGSLIQGGLTALPGAWEAKDTLLGARAAAGAADTVAPEAIAKSPGLFSRIFNGGAKQVTEEGADKTAANVATDATSRTAEIVPKKAGLGDIKDVFKPAGEDTNFISKTGSKFRAGARGVETGAVPEGTSAALRPDEAKGINQFLDSVGAKGSAEKQVARVQQVQEQAAEQIDNVVKNSAKPVGQEDLMQAQNNVEKRLLGENGKGAGKFNPSDTAHVDVANNYARQMGDIKDSEGWLNFKRTLDQDINYSRKSATPDPLTEQIAGAFRKEASAQLDALHPELAGYNKLYSQAAEAEDALIKNTRPKGIKTMFASVNNKGVAGKPVQALEDTAGRLLQGVGKAASTPVGRQLIMQQGERGVAAGLGLPGVAPDQQPTPPVIAPVPTDPNNGLDPSNPDAGAINQIIASGETDPEQINQLLSATDNAGAGVGDGNSPEELFAMAKKAADAGDYKTSDQYLQLAQYAYTAAAGTAKATASEGKLSTAQQARHDALQSALGSLDVSGTNLDASGGAKGLGGELGKLPWVGKYIDPQGAAYTNTKIELATQLAKAITGGSKPGQDVIDKYMHSLPDINDTPEYAAAKLDKLKKELQSQAKAFNFTDLLGSTDPSTALFQSLSPSYQ